MLEVHSKSYNLPVLSKAYKIPVHSKELCMFQVVQGVVYGIYGIMSTNV